MKMRSMIQSNAAILFRSLLEQGLTIAEAAAQIGISQDLLGKLIREDKIISMKTASRLYQAFGADAVKIEQRAKEAI